MTPIQNSTTVAGVFWNPDINPDVFMFMFYHFVSFVLIVIERLYPHAPF